MQQQQQGVVARQPFVTVCHIPASILLLYRLYGNRVVGKVRTILPSYTNANTDNYRAARTEMQASFNINTYASGIVRQRQQPVEGHDRLFNHCIHVAEFLANRQTGVRRKSQTVDAIPPPTTDRVLLQRMDTCVVCAIGKYIYMIPC